MNFDWKIDPAGNHMIKVRNEYTRSIFWICSKLKKKMPEWFNWHCYVAFIINFEYVYFISPVWPYVDFDHVTGFVKFLRTHFYTEHLW